MGADLRPALRILDVCQFNMSNDHTVLELITEQIDKISHKLQSFIEGHLSGTESRLVQRKLEILKGAQKGTMATKVFFNYLTSVVTGKQFSTIKNVPEAREIESDVEVFLEYLKKVVMRCNYDPSTWKVIVEGSENNWVRFKVQNHIDSRISEITTGLLGNYDEAPYYGDIRKFLELDEHGQQVNMSTITQPDEEGVVAPPPPRTDFLHVSNPYHTRGRFLAMKQNPYYVSI